MGKTDLLRVQDVRDAYRLIGECRDLGGDPALWQRRMLEGACRLFGAQVATGGEGRWIRPHRSVEVVSAFDAGFDPSGRELFMAYHRELGPRGDPIFCALQRVPGRLVTRTRRQLVSDADWYRSAACEYRRPLGMDEELTSVYQVVDDGAISVIALARPAREPEFSPREQRLVTFFHEELGRLIGRADITRRRGPRIVKTTVRRRSASVRPNANQRASMPGRASITTTGRLRKTCSASVWLTRWRVQFFDAFASSHWNPSIC